MFYTAKDYINANITSSHFRNHPRLEALEKAGGFGEPLQRFGLDLMFERDTGHTEGTEIHILTDNGIILIFNKDTKRFVTFLIARPEKLLKYTTNIPAYVLNKAKQHTKEGLNMC